MNDSRSLVDRVADYTDPIGNAWIEMACDHADAFLEQLRELRALPDTSAKRVET